MLVIVNSYLVYFCLCFSLLSHIPALISLCHSFSSDFFHPRISVLHPPPSASFLAFILLLVGVSFVAILLTAVAPKYQSGSEAYFWTVSQRDTFLRRGVMSTSPNSQVGGPQLFGCPRLLIQYIRSYPPYWRPFLHPQPGDAPCRGDRHGRKETTWETQA